MSALYSLSKTAGDASAATVDFIDLLEGAGHDTTGLRDAFSGIAPSLKRVADSISSPEAVNGDVDEPAAIAAPETKAPRKRAKKDPDAPKRPLPAQLIFINEQRRLIRDERAGEGKPPLSRQESQDMLAGRWDALPKAEREKLESEHQKAMEEYHRQVKEYQARKAEAGEAGEAAPATSK